MAEVRLLKTMPDKERSDSIEVLEEMLVEARAGNVQSVLIAVVNPDTTMGFTWSSGTAAMMLGAIRALEHAFLMEEIGRPDFE